MVTIKNNGQKEIIVYALVSQISNEIYVWMSQASNYYSAYKKHANGQNLQTKDLFKRSEEKKSFPKMYLLEKLKLTRETTFSYCVAWSKYFQDHGWQVIAYPKVLSYLESLNDDTAVVFEHIKTVPIETVLSEDHLIVKGYRRIEKNRAPKNEIKITVSHKEYKMVQEQAERAKMTMSRYCKNNVLKGYIVSPTSLPTLPIYEYMGELREAKVILKQLLDSIYRTGKYYPADMENIQAMIERITKQQNLLHRDFKNYVKEIKKILPH